MAVLELQIRGLKSVTRPLNNLGPQMEKEIVNKSHEFMKFVQKSAKLRAPRKSGDLARSIRVFKRKKTVQLIVGSPYGRYQEEGFRPHWIHALLPSKNRFSTVGNALDIAGFAFVSKNTPFVAPALEAGLSRLPSMLSDGADKAIKKAGF